MRISGGRIHHAFFPLRLFVLPVWRSTTSPGPPCNTRSRSVRRCGLLCYQVQAHHSPRPKSIYLLYKVTAATRRGTDQNIQNRVGFIPFLRSLSSSRRSGSGQPIVVSLGGDTLYTCSRLSGGSPVATGCDSWYQSLTFLGMGLVGFDFAMQQKRGGALPVAEVKMSAANRVMGTVRWVNSTKGSGFVTPDNGGEYLYFHQPSLKSDGCILNVGDSVEFEVCTGNYGSPKAFDIMAPDGGTRGCFCPNGSDHGGGNGCYGGERACGFHADGGDRGHGVVLCGGDGDLDCDIGSGYGISSSHGCHSHEQGALLVLSEGASLVFDQMPIEEVVWDEELLNGLDSCDGLLQQLAEGSEFMRSQEIVRECSHAPPSCELISRDVDNMMLLSSGTVMGSAHKVLDELPSLNVVWDDDMSQDCGLLKQFVQAGEDRKPTVELFTSSMVWDIEAEESHDEMSCKNVVWDEGISSYCDTHGEWLQQLAMGAGCSVEILTSDVVRDEDMAVNNIPGDSWRLVAMEEEYNNDKKVKAAVELVAAEVLTHVSSLPLFLEYGLKVAEKVLVKAFNKQKPKKMSSVSEACSIATETPSWVFVGFSPWSKPTHKSLRLVFLADDCQMDTEYRRLYIFFEPWDPGISWMVLENIIASMDTTPSSVLITKEMVMPVMQMISTAHPTKLLAHLRLSFSARSSIFLQKLMLQSESEMAGMLLTWKTISCNYDKRITSQDDVLVTHFSLTVSMVLLLWLKASQCQTEPVNHDRTYFPIKIWDPGIPSYTAAGTYEISSSVLFIQNSFMLLAPLLEVLSPAYLKMESTYSTLSVSTNIWLKLGVSLVTSQLKMMAFRLFSHDEKGKSVRSKRQQADLRDEELRTGGSQEIKSINGSLGSYISIIWQWDPGIAKFRLHEAGDDGLNRRTWETKNEYREASRADHSVAWGQATFCGGGSVTPGLYDDVGFCATKSKPTTAQGPSRSICSTKSQQQHGEGQIRIFRTELGSSPSSGRCLPHGGAAQASRSSSRSAAIPCTRAHVSVVARRWPRAVTPLPFPVQIQSGEVSSGRNPCLGSCRCCRR